MPLQKNPFCKGNLFIKINVDFPPDGILTPSSISILQNVRLSTLRCLTPARALRAAALTWFV